MSDMTDPDIYHRQAFKRQVWGSLWSRATRC